MEGTQAKAKKTLLLTVQTESEADEWSIENVKNISSTLLNPTTLNRSNSYNITSRNRNSGCTSVVKSWYTPVYDFSDPNLTDEQRLKRKRYCYGRLSLPAFVCLHILIFLILFWAIFLPILLLVIIPSIVQNTFEGIGGDMLNVQR
jgi:hypothetical protein